MRPLILLAALLPVSAASAAEMTMYLKNLQPLSVALEFTSRDTGSVWPGDDQVYQLDPKARKAVFVTCQPGERICMGAWIEGNDKYSWGIGPDRDKTCTNCCRICTDHAVESFEIGGDE